MARKSASTLASEMASTLVDNSAGLITPLTLRTRFTDLYDSIPLLDKMWVANNAGSVDVTESLDTFLAAAAGALVYIPPGTYRVNELNPDYSLNIWAHPGTVTFIYDIEMQCINAVSKMQTYLTSGITQLSVSSITYGDFVDGYSFTTDTDYVSILTVSDTSAFTVGDLVHICSDNMEPWGNSRYGETFTLLGKTATLLYVNGKLEFHDYYATTPTVTKVKMDRTFSVRGIKFKANGSWRADACVRNGNGGWAINLWGYPRATIENCEFTELWTGACTLRFCPNWVFKNNKVTLVANYKTAAPDVLLGSNPIATISGEPWVYVAHTAHGFATGAHFCLTKSSGAAAIGGIPSAEIYDKGVNIEVIGTNAYRYLATAVQGNVSAAGASTLTDFRQAFATNTHAAKVVTITSGTGAGQTRTISSNTATTLTVSSPWSSTPDATSKYTISTPATSTVGTVTGSSPTASVTGGGGGSNVNQDWISGRLGYGINAYGAGANGVCENNIFELCRHAITTGGYEDSGPFAAGSYYKYGVPTKCVFKGNVAIDSWGPPFDTHEQGSGLTFINNISFWPSRGPDGGSYIGMGFQNRSRNTIVNGYTQIGGSWGMRFTAFEHRDCVHQIDNIVLRDIKRSATGSSDGTGLMFDSQSGFTYKYKTRIGHVQMNGVELGVYVNADQDVQIDNLSIRNWTSYGIYMAGAAANLRVNNYVTNNDSGQVADYAIMGNTAANFLHVQNAYIRGVSTSSSFAAVNVPGTATYTFGNLTVDGGAYAVRTAANTSVITIDKLIARNCATRFLDVNSSITIWDMLLDAGTASPVDGLQCSTSSVTVTLGKGRVRGVTNAAIQLDASCTLKADDLKLETTGGASTYGIYTLGSCVLNLDRLTVDTATVGVLLDTSSSMNVDRLSFKNVSTVGIDTNSGASFNVGEYYGRNLVNDHFELEQDVSGFVGYAYMNDGKSLIDAQKNGRMRVGKLVADYRGNTAAANCHIVLARSDSTSIVGGTATAGASTTLTDSGQAWTVNAYAGRSVQITSGTGAGQERIVASNTATVLTVTTAWNTNPDATSVYKVILGGCDIGIDEVFVRKDDNVGLPQFIFSEQDTSARKRVWVGTITEDNWSNVVTTYRFSHNATTFDWNQQITRRRYGSASLSLTQTPKSITGATQANPVVVTVGSSHGFATNDLVYISGVVGMTQLNGNIYRVTTQATSTITLGNLDGSAIDGTGFGAWSSGGTAAPVIDTRECATGGSLVVYANNASALTYGLPKVAQVGEEVRLIQQGAGQVTFAAETGANLRNRQSHTKTAGQYAEVRLRVISNSSGSAAEWLLTGDTGA